MNSIFTNGWGTFNGNLPDPATNLELQNPSRDGPELNEIFADRLISDTIAKEPLRWLQRFDGKTIISLFYLFANIPVRAGDLYSAQLPEKAAIISSRRPLIFRSAKERRKKKTTDWDSQTIVKHLVNNEKKETLFSRHRNRHWASLLSLSSSLFSISLLASLRPEHSTEINNTHSSPDISRSRFLWLSWFRYIALMSKSLFLFLSLLLLISRACTHDAAAATNK